LRGEGPESDAEGVDLSAPSLREWALYVLHAAQRQRWLVAGVFVAGMAVTTAYYFTKTPLYRVETKVLAQRQQSLPSIARSGAPDEAPTRTAYEVVHRRENLVSLLKQTNLVPAPGSEPAASGWRRWLSRALSTGQEPDDASDEALNRLVLRLDKELVVTVGDGTITISLDWPNPEEAYQLVQAALQNFLEARQVHEITAIDDAISLLQERLVAARAQLVKATDEAQHGAVRATSDLAPGRPALRGPASEELQMLGVALEAKERSIRDLEEFRRRRLMELQAQLQEKRGIYSDSYPAVIALRKEVDAMNQESPQVAALQEEARRMREEYTARAGEENRNRPPSSRNGASATVRSVPSVPVVEDQAVRDARVQYEQMLSRVNAARADLDTARAAFKYRYTVAWPARVPRKPVSPNPVTVFGLGTLASLLLAFAAAVRFGVSDELIRERWQVERKLGLPVLAEFTRR
jgi:uncharacterized protein involved in exopolysaccharide biosynthesis